MRTMMEWTPRGWDSAACVEDVVPQGPRPIVVVHWIQNEPREVVQARVEDLLDYNCPVILRTNLAGMRALKEHGVPLGGLEPTRVGELFFPALHVSTQAELEEGMPALAGLRAVKRVLWVEPRERIDLGQWPFGGLLRQCPEPAEVGEVAACEGCPGGGPDCPGEWDHPISWVVCRGGAEPVHPEWVRDLRADVHNVGGIGFTFLGWGEWTPRISGTGHAAGKDIARVESKILFEDGQYEDGRAVLPGGVEGLVERIATIQRRRGVLVARTGRFRSGVLLDGKVEDTRPEAAR